MKLRGRFFLLAFGLLPFLLLLSGCGGTKPPEKKKKTKQETDLPGTLRGKGWHIVWKAKDVKTGGNPENPVLAADAEEGSLTSDTETPTIHLEVVTAKLYREGKHRANLRAAHVTANQSQKRVVCTGGVTLESVGTREQNVLQSDQMVWNVTTGVIVADGNASLKRTDRRGSVVGTHEGGRIRYNTRNESFDVE